MMGVPNLLMKTIVHADGLKVSCTNTELNIQNKYKMRKGRGVEKEQA